MTRLKSAMTEGPEVRDAYNKMEKLEHTARLVLAAAAPGTAAAAAPGGGREAAAPGGKV
jgi:hypothetical protein